MHFIKFLNLECRNISIRMLETCINAFLCHQMHDSMDNDSFIRERHAFSHFSSFAYAHGVTVCMQIIYCKRIPRHFHYQTVTQYLLTSRPSLREKVSERGEVRQACGAAHRGHAIYGRQETRTYIRRYIFTPSCDCISSKFSVLSHDKTSSAKKQRSHRPYIRRAGVKLMRLESW